MSEFRATFNLSSTDFLALNPGLDCSNFTPLTSVCIGDVNKTCNKPLDTSGQCPDWLSTNSLVSPRISSQTGTSGTLSYVPAAGRVKGMDILLRWALTVQVPPTVGNITLSLSLRMAFTEHPDLYTILNDVAVSYPSCLHCFSTANHAESMTFETRTRLHDPWIPFWILQTNITFVPLGQVDALIMVVPATSSAVSAVYGNPGHPFISLWKAGIQKDPLVIAIVPGWFTTGGIITFIPGDQV